MTEILDSFEQETLTDEERATIRRNRKPANELPTYFDGDLDFTTGDGEVTITRDFEAFLITKDIDDLKLATKWLDEARSLSDPRRDRDTILLDTLVGMETANNAQLQEYDTTLDTFNEYLATFPDPRFKATTEVGKIQEDLRAVIGEQIAKRDQSFYMQTFVGLLKKKATAAQVSTTLTRELESWAGPLSAYISRK